MSDAESDSDLRRRAAWLLGMLAVVAVLFIVVMTQVVGGSGGNDKANTTPGVDDSAVAAQPSNSASHSQTRHRPSKGPTNSADASGGSITSGVSGTKCPGQQACILGGDPGNGVAAINEYRVKQGKPPVPGRVSKNAQQCALRNGTGCTGGWAETQLGKLDGPMAVQKILQFGRLLNPMKSIEIGWAYDPRAKQYYFAIIRDE